jgi:putative ABC transport system permease protein
VLAVADLTITGPGGTHELMLIGVGPGPAGRPTGPVAGRFPGQGELLADATEAPGGLGVGDTVTVEPGGVSMHVVGTAPGIRYADVTTAWTTWASVLKAANPAGQILPNAVAVRAGPGVTASELVSRLATAIPGVQVFTRAQAVANIPGASTTTATLDVLIAVAFIAALLVIGSVFLLITVQRSRVWTLLRAIGSHAGRLGLTVVAQAAIVVVLASVVASAALTIVAAASGSNLPLHAAPSLMLSTTAAMLVGAAFTTLLPVRRIGRIDPAEAMGRA